MRLLLRLLLSLGTVLCENVVGAQVGGVVDEVSAWVGGKGGCVVTSLPWIQGEAVTELFGRWQRISLAVTSRSLLFLQRVSFLVLLLSTCSMSDG